MARGGAANAPNLLPLSGIAGMAGLAAGSTRSRMTRSGHWAQSENWRNLCAISYSSPGREVLGFWYCRLGPYGSGVNSSASHLLGGNMTNRFLFALIVLFSFAAATPPAEAFPIAAPLLDIQSTDTSGAFILF